ncbi:MAG: hypothetical protein KJ799_06140, partial [Bacteroidetes bacterium]|nr:hypothetical protein [Bacteroidota bacterium]
CEDDNTVNPKKEEPTTCEYEEGNRSFTWQVDTVAWFPSMLGGVWAFSDTDAYAMGNIIQKTSGGLIGYIGLHWNGKTWGHDINGKVSEIKHVSNDVTGDEYYMVSVGNWSINPPKPALGEFDNRTKRWKGYQYQIEGELRSVWTDGNGYFIAVGDNGMVYIKDGYSAGWEYSTAPTDFHFYKVVGVSKNEMYFIGYKNIAIGGISYYQIWKYYNENWYVLYDSQDTTGNVLSIHESSIGDIGAVRCELTDSLKLYVMGWESYLFESKGDSLNFSATNLSELGLPLRSMGRTALRIFLFSPNDYWVMGSKYNFFHWNGTDYQAMYIPGVPSNIDHSGSHKRMVKTKTGKIFFPTEVSLQVYVIAQGAP